MKLIRAPMGPTFYRLLATFFLIVLILCFIPATLDGQTAQPSNVSTASVLYQFTGGTDGGTPNAGVIFDNAGNLYGTTTVGGLYGHGTVYELSPSPSGWTESVLYSFTGGEDGDLPLGGVIFDAAGNLYGTTFQGGQSCGLVGCGTVFELVPTPDGWTFSLVHSFTCCDDGANPAAGLILDGHGVMFGTTEYGGPLPSGICSHDGCGTVFHLAPYFNYSRFSPKKGANPNTRLLYDYAGGRECYWGTTLGSFFPFDSWGTVFRDCNRSIQKIHTFVGNSPLGLNPMGGLAMDSAGNVYGTTSVGGGGGAGTVFEIVYSPYARSWPTKALHQFPVTSDDGEYPVGDLILDPDGNLYGTTVSGGTNNNGIIFKLTPAIKQKWTETVLYRFAGSDGANPYSGVVFDGAGDLYGTTSAGGAYGAGVVYKVPNIRVGPKAFLTPTSLRFPNQVVNTSSPAKAVTFANTGDSALNISNITVSPADNFAISSNTCGATLTPGTQCKVSVSFTPTTMGTFTATLIFTDNAPNSPQTVSLTGNGMWPATLMPSSQTYAARAVGTTSLPKTFTLSNNQPVTLDNIVISTTGDFAVSSTTCTTSLAAKSKCTINVTFTPTQTGTRTGTLSVSDNASNSPQTSSLTGTGK